MECLASNSRSIRVNGGPPALHTRSSILLHSTYFIKGFSMANVKQGNLTKSPQWWKHLKDWKRVFWKSERQAQKRNINNGE